MEETTRASSATGPPDSSPFGQASSAFVTPRVVTPVSTPPAVEPVRMVRLLWILGALLAVLIAPTIVGRIRYAYTYNTQKAEAAALKLSKRLPHL